MVKLFFIGMLMGLADLIPGISSGTIAYSLNVYQIWIDALNSIALSELFFFRFRSFFKKIHFHTLLPILSGIIASVVIFTNVIFLILSHAFIKDIFLLGVSCLIALSCICFSKKLKFSSKLDVAYILLGFVIATVVSILPKITNENPNAFFVFIGAVVAAFAMMLPGISGSAMLLLFNLYERLIQKIKEFLSSFQLFSSSVSFLGIFLLGVIFGIAIFSNILKNLLKNQPQKTNMVLFGLMLGCVFGVASIVIKICFVAVLLLFFYLQYVHKKILITCIEKR